MFLLAFAVAPPVAAVAATPAAHSQRESAAGCATRPAVRPRSICGSRPNTAIVAGPPSSVTPKAVVSFSFRSSRDRARFECRLDSGRWAECRSPKSYSGVGPGPHSFAVRARDREGLGDPTPASRSFEVVAPVSVQAPDVTGKPSPPVVVAPAPSATPPTPPPPTPTPVVPPVGNGELFGADSIWGQPVPGTNPIDPSSPSLIANLLSRVEAEGAARVGQVLGTKSRTSLYRVGSEQARVPVYLDTGPWGDNLAARFQAGVPIPTGAAPVIGSDHALAVWQASTDSYWEFYLMQQALHGPQFARAPTAVENCGSLAGDYVYRLTSLNEHGESKADATASIHVAAGSCVTIKWAPIFGATGYRVYRGAEGAPARYLATVPPGLSSYVDDGSRQTNGEAAPGKSTAETPGQWHASYGGFVPDVSRNPGYYQDLTDGGGNVTEQSSWGAAASGMPLAAGLITKEDIDRGKIDHALSIGLANGATDSLLRAGSFAFPAQRSDGRSAAADSIPEGARLVLDPELDVTALGLTPFVRMLAEAAQTYGMIVHDGSEGTVIYAEDPTPYVAEGQPNFYRPWVGSNTVGTLAGFPWADLRVVRMDLCTQRPCAAA